MHAGDLAADQWIAMATKEPDQVESPRPDLHPQGGEPDGRKERVQQHDHAGPMRHQAGHPRGGRTGPQAAPINARTPTSAAMRGHKRER